MALIQRIYLQIRLTRLIQIDHAKYFLFNIWLLLDLVKLFGNYERLVTSVSKLLSFQRISKGCHMNVIDCGYGDLASDTFNYFVADGQT